MSLEFPFQAKAPNLLPANHARPPAQVMKLNVVHSIEYTYSAPVVLAPQHILMRPRESHLLAVNSYQLEVNPATPLYWSRDHHENSLAIAYYYERMESLSVRAAFEVETRDRNPFDFIVRLDAGRYPFDYMPAESAMLAPYLDTPDGKSRPLLAWMRSIIKPFPDETLDLLTKLNTAMQANIEYRHRLEPGAQAPEETIEKQSGTCRDFALLMVHACHALGLAARFVSGYLFDPTVEDGDTGSLHAWAEVYLPGAGWKGFDPTHGILTDEHFIPVSVGRGPFNLNPVTGAFWGAKDTTSHLEASVTIREI